eukprot:GILK01001593.1.p1 GENE.GILK01001593.1~~GILK01001593.1.p1  ORF type:complete len:490 (-),score=59.72 GILK01001593.1:102-1517(-)
MATKRASTSEDGSAAKKMKTVPHAKGSVEEFGVEYMEGFGNHFTSEVLPGALPKGQNNPQKCPYGLYAEQLSGTAFTLPRHRNQRSWLYRIRPSVCHDPFEPSDYPDTGKVLSAFEDNALNVVTKPNQIRWQPLPLPEQPQDFLGGLLTYCGAGSPDLKAGIAIHMYVANTSMVDTAFCSADGDMLFVAQQGVMKVQTEFGVMRVAPGEIFVVQRGMRFAILVEEGPIRGYICEVFKGHFVIPDLGVIGSNGLANPRDFLTPVAAYEDRDCDFTIIQKFQGKFFKAKMDHSIFDVVAWHGNYAPYKYDLAKFCCINSVTFDHPDPSIYCVLTCQTDEPGVAVCDFVIFPPRWMVMEHTFRPPWFHRNLMSEFMGNIRGKYDAKEEGFLPGGASLHSCMAPHGPEAAVFEKMSTVPLAPTKIPDDSLAFMFETTYLMRLGTHVVDAPHLDRKYHECWRDIQKHFDPTRPEGN